MNNQTTETVLITFLVMSGCVAWGVLLANLVLSAICKRATDRRRRYADYCGFQEGYGSLPGFHLWTLRDSRLGTLHTTIDQKWLDDAIERYEGRTS